MGAIDDIEDSYQSIEKELRDLGDNYSRWPLQSVQEQSHKVMGELKQHFQEQETRVQAAMRLRPGVTAVFNQAMKERKELAEELDIFLNHQFHLDLQDFLKRMHSHVKSTHDLLKKELP
jgi:predicted  nucleic acid-binding Zn-ribbon protein